MARALNNQKFGNSPDPQCTRAARTPKGALPAIPSPPLLPPPLYTALQRSGRELSS